MAKSKTRIVIADDHALIRKGLRQVLESQPDFEIMEAENGAEAIELIREELPDIAILDIEMPEMTGYEVAAKVENESIQVDLIFLTMFKDESIFNRAMDIGVKGYVLKENTVSEIINCIKTVSKGKYYLSPAISDFLIRRNNRLANPAADSRGIDQLTPAETNILKLLAMMKTNQEIATELSISIKTVQNHRNNICNKLDLSGTHALLKFAVENTHLL
ncbi:MAG TPA: DNA-binding response regulator [Balneolaceae bacterium]|nr:DNA-binding response regulator [Balneolaceae bacterium]|tara:strand:- start:168584 stop:169237 length:654 start_codon:yes stop_codon:yes gene_type:complete